VFGGYFALAARQMLNRVSSWHYLLRRKGEIVIRAPSTSQNYSVSLGDNCHTQKARPSHISRLARLHYDKPGLKKSLMPLTSSAGHAAPGGVNGAGSGLCVTISIAKISAPYPLDSIRFEKAIPPGVPPEPFLASFIVISQSRRDPDGSDTTMPCGTSE
jgi:hypothetical protein